MSSRLLFRSGLLRIALSPLDHLGMAFILSLGMAIIAGVVFFASTSS